MPNKRVVLSILTAVCVLGCVGQASCSIIRVKWDSPNDGPGNDWDHAYHTVTAGLNAAASGDEVWVAAGTYVERITLKPGVALYGGFAGTETAMDQRNWTANVTILDGDKGGRVVTSPSGATSSTRIDGFTIRNGCTDGSGGGIYGSDSSPTIANNTVAGNRAESCGGGIRVSGSATITNNTITGNSAWVCAGGVWVSGSAKLANNTIANNRVTGTGISDCGGGVFISGSATVTNNAIRGNTAPRGGGIYAYCTSAPTPTIITNNTIAANSVSGEGGGLYVRGSKGSAAIANNTIAANCASSHGGGLYLENASAVVANTIVAFNSSGVYAYGGSPTLTYNCVYGNPDYNYSRISDPTGTDGNISADPDFAGVEYGNWHIQPASPCVDAGGNSYVYGASDIDGQARIQPSGGTVDIGADESDGTAWPAGPYAIIRVSTEGDDSNDGLSWAAAKRTVQGGIDAASALGGEVWVRAGTYYERITLLSFASIYGGFAGAEIQREQRNWNANVTVLDGQQGGSVVTVPVGPTVSTIDGFIITNGKSGKGSGIYVEGASPSITHNNVRGNRQGGGIYSSGGSPNIADNAIMANSASDRGGGIYAGGSSTIINNTVSANSGHEGGGIYVYGSATVSGNTIAANSASDYGGGIYAAGSPTITGNTIAANTAQSYSGGGIYVSGSPAITNNTIAANIGSQGGGIHVAGMSSAPTIANTIIAFNSSGVYRQSGSLTFKHNCVYGNAAYDYSRVADPTGTDGNISVDPEFASADYGNWHIQPDSPCADAGDNSYAYGDCDIDGQPRIQPPGGTADIGADESDGTVWPAGPYTIVRVSIDGDDSEDGSSWPAAKRTVQAAIDTANALGGEVWVKAGTYYERVTLLPFVGLYGGFAGVETERDQRDWNSNVTVLDGQQGGSVVRALNGYEVSAIDGFTITNGSAHRGGGIDADCASPSIMNNSVTGNTASTYGGGIYVSRSAVIANNAITANTASYGGAISASGSTAITNNTIAANSGKREGGGIYATHSPTITENAITENGAGSNGGGIYASGSPTITNNLLARNSSGSGGGGVYASGSATIANNTISANDAQRGGGLYLPASTSAQIVANNTITGNTAYFFGYGGGIYVATSARITGNTITANGATTGAGLYVTGASSAPTIANSIIAFNSSGLHVDSGAPVLRHNCVYANMDYDYSGIPDPTGTDGNISADPKFANVGLEDWHIQPDSPCVDAGDNLSAFGDFDMDGQARLQPAGGTADIGADESDGTAWPAPPYAIIRVSTDGDDSNDGSSWAAAKRTVQAGIDAACAGGGEVWVKAGTYFERIRLRRSVSLYGGFVGVETEREQRDSNSNVTILDGQQGGSVVTVPLPYESGAIDGFTIQNGSGTPLGGTGYGGGIRSLWSSPTVSNCTVTNNEATFGGGISCTGGAPVIARNVITQNNVHGVSGPLSGSWGGGIVCESGSLATITNNIISYNTAPDFCAGGIELVGSSAIVTNNRIEFNTAYWASAGIDTNSCSPVICNNIIRGNVVTDDSINYSGGGAGLWTIGGAPLVTNNTFVDNHTGSKGGAIWLTSTAGQFCNNIIAFNSSGVYAKTPLGTPLVKYNCYYANTQYHQSGLYPRKGDIFDLDPLLLDWMAGDCHLTPFSPCVDAGWNDAPGLPLFDFDGQGRIWNGIVDIGADELWPLSTSIDIKPGAYPNPINLRSGGLVPVAILSEPDFSAESVDPETVMFAGAPVATRGPNDRPMAGLHDVDGDGDRDLLLHFETRLLQLNAASTSASLSGKTYDGWPIEGSDSILVVPNPRPR